MNRTGCHCIARRQAEHSVTCPRCADTIDEDSEVTREDAGEVDAWLGRSLEGRYVINQKIGAGASGMVYQGRDLVLGGRVAIKIVCLEDASDDETSATRSQLERVEREVRATATISHPNLVHFVDFIEFGSTHAAIVMELVEGETLGAMIEREGPLGLGRAVDIAAQVASAMGAMHDKHVVHRDLKPANIIVQQLSGQGDYCRVIDFGVVRYEDDSDRTHAFLGTPLYASPEQVMSESIDHRSDIYSLGAVLFEMLTGRPPFQAKKAFAALVAHARTAPPTLTEATDEASFPEWIEELVADMLDKRPEERPQTMAELIRRLRGGAELHAAEKSPMIVSLFADETHERLVYLDGDSEVYERDSCSSAVDREVWNVRQKVTALAAASDGIIAGTSIGSVEKFDSETGQTSTLYHSATGESVTAVRSADDGSVVAGFDSGRVRWSNGAVAGRPWMSLPTGEPVTAVAISSSNGAIAVCRASGETEVYVISRSLSRPTVRIQQNTPVRRVDFSADGYLIGTETEDEKLRIFSVAKGALLTQQAACPYSASPDRATCAHSEECPIAMGRTSSASARFGEAAIA
jgi:serine/threonine protein kinase